MKSGGTHLGRYFLLLIVVALSLFHGQHAHCDPTNQWNLTCLEDISCVWALPSDGLDMLRSIASDRQGGIFAAGWREGSEDERNNWLIQKLIRGCGLSWSYGTDFGDYDEVMDMTIDSQGNVLASGWRHYEGEHAWLVAKLNAAGTLLWMHPYKIDGTGEGWCRARGICSDHQDKVYAAGFTHIVSTDGYYRAIRKYESDGTFVKDWDIEMFAWDIAYAYDEGLSQHYLVVVGFENTATQGSDVRVVRYDLDGNLIWTYQYNGPGDGNDMARGVAISANQEIFVAGCEMSLDSGYDGLLVKLDPRTGNEIGKATYDDSVDEQFWGVAVDSRGLVAAVGHKEGGGHLQDWLVTIHGSSCELLCSTEYSDSFYDDNDVAVSVVFDIDGSVVVGGYEHNPDMDWRIAKYQCVLTPVPSDEIPQAPYQGTLRVFPNPLIRSEAVRGTVKFEGLDLGSQVRLYTVRGLLVWEGAVEQPYILEWNGCNKTGEPVAPGSYLWVAESGDMQQRGTLVVE